MPQVAPKAAVKNEAKPKTKAGTKAKAEAKPEDSTKPEDGTEAGAEGEGEGEAKGKTKTKKRPAAKKNADHPHADRYGNIPYHGLKVDAEGEPTVKLTEVPEDWDRHNHIMLRQKNFETEALYLDWRALEYERRAKEMREKAEESRKLGDSADRGKAKRLLAMRKKMAALADELRDSGIDVDSILGDEDGEENGEG